MQHRYRLRACKFVTDHGKEKSFGKQLNKNINIKSRRGESNFISAIRSIIDADMARKQRVHGICKDFYVIQNRFSCSVHQ